MAAYKFYRINILAPVSGTYVMLTSVRFWADPDATVPISTEGAVATADSYVSYPPSQAINSSLSDFWYATGQPNWWQIEFATAQDVQAFDLFGHLSYADNSPKDWNLEGSSDGTTWTRIKDFVGSPPLTGNVWNAFDTIRRTTRNLQATYEVIAPSVVQANLQANYDTVAPVERTRELANSYKATTPLAVTRALTATYEVVAPVPVLANFPHSYRVRLDPEVALTLPALAVSTRAAPSLSLALPAIALKGEATHGSTVSASLVLPVFATSISSAPGLNVLLPAYAVAAHGAGAVTAYGGAVLPAITISAAGSPNIYGTVGARLPTVRVRLSAWQGGLGVMHGAVQFRVAATGQTGTLGVSI